MKGQTKDIVSDINGQYRRYVVNRIILLRRLESICTTQQESIPVVCLMPTYRATKCRVELGFSREQV